ncbi:hypothetical protein LTR10_001436 [Elasticomyces elasticus]|nr:hypothetical protein LTR10_001436 [Elasticomyces elasticus]KAK4974937.1 hypothetical protein LTR42_004146 [Elasticomyces elasticus]
MSNVGPPYITHINYFCPAPEQHHEQHHDQHHDQQHDSPRSEPAEPLDSPGHDQKNIYANEFALSGITDSFSYGDNFNDDRFIEYWRTCKQQKKLWAECRQAMHDVSGFQHAMLFDPALMGLDHYSCPHCATMGVRHLRQGLGMGGMRGHGTWGGMGGLGSGYEQNTMGQGVMPPPPQAPPHMPGVPNFAPNNLPGSSHPVGAPLVPAMPNVVPNNLAVSGRPAVAPGGHMVASQQPVYQAPVVAQAFAQASAGPFCTGHARHARHVREQEPAGLLSRMYRALW